MTADDLLSLLSLSGPFLSISRLVGKERAQKIEKSLVEWGKKLLRMTPMLLRLALILVLLYGFFIILGVAPRLLPDDAQAILGLLMLIFFIPWTRIQSQWAHAVISNVSTKWQEDLGTPPPWPFAIVGGKYQFRYVFWTMNAMPFLIAFYSILLPIAIVAMLFALMPFQVADWARSKLTPENPSYFDILGWGISAVAVLLATYKRFAV